MYPPDEDMKLAFFLPKYWVTWWGLGIMRCVDLLPFPLQRLLGNAIGLLLRRLPLAQVRIARRNIDLCLPELTPQERSDLLDRHFRSLGMGLCETANSWWSSDRRVNKLAEVHGIHHLQAALAQGRGAIVVSGHFTTIEISTRILGTVVPLNVVYRPSKNALLTHTMVKSFRRNGKPIAKDDIRSMIRALKRNEPVWYAPDQSYRNKGAAMVNFFGIPAATNTATSRLARISGAPVLTYFAERLSGNGGYRVVIGAALENFPGADPLDDAERYNRLLEAQIRRVPEQYLWVHRRFKGLSSDYPNYYGRDSRGRAPVLRTATMADVPGLRALIARSARGLSTEEYRPAQIEGALQGAFGVDTQLLTDQTYFVVEAAGLIVGCGGWSFRSTLFGGDARNGRDCSTLDPQTQAAKIRAFFVDPGHARRGIGSLLLEHCEQQARAHGYSQVELMATLPGAKLYAARGYVAESLVHFEVGSGESIEFIPMRKSFTDGVSAP
jgi:Kdo2-lipid IVA lauroyltransferase/acyltransferase